ncbi:uncharacterized protein H6S33_001696 [Morchella sextelata]|uniref:uncharacterized protein n=1 Tax=Morchella sextelata TaxID=1174677 RepID=UPI001D048ECF|nr:uncharacterized protein H6S33_001696 [Morchella sextelata]KAH0608562.1 hypothetical protein H6S33_001696 [Morchella sextelata]
MRGDGGRLGMESDEDKCLVSRGMRPAAEKIKQSEPDKNTERKAKAGKRGATEFQTEAGPSKRRLQSNERRKRKSPVTDVRGDPLGIIHDSGNLTRISFLLLQLVLEGVNPFNQLATCHTR